MQLFFGGGGKAEFPWGAVLGISLEAWPCRQLLVTAEEVGPTAGYALTELSHTFLSGKKVSVLCHGLLALSCLYSGLLVLQTAALKGFALKISAILESIKIQMFFLS